MTPRDSRLKSAWPCTSFAEAPLSCTRLGSLVLSIRLAGKSKMKRCLEVLKKIDFQSFIWLTHWRGEDWTLLGSFFPLPVLTVSPNKQYRGILLPTTPATHGPSLWKVFGKFARLRSKVGRWLHVGMCFVIAFRQRKNLWTSTPHFSAGTESVPEDEMWRESVLLCSSLGDFVLSLLPECIPILILNLSPGRWGIVKFPAAWRMLRASFEMIAAWLVPLRFGNPLTTCGTNHSMNHRTNSVSKWKIHHIRIPNSFHFVGIVMFDDTIKQLVEMIQHRHHFGRRAFCRYRCEWHYTKAHSQH